MNDAPEEFRTLESDGIVYSSVNSEKRNHHTGEASRSITPSRRNRSKNNTGQAKYKTEIFRKLLGNNSQKPV